MNTAVAHDYSGAPLGAPVYELTKVSKTYARNRVIALEDVSLTLRKGSFTSIIGSSGCGKSTLLKIMAGLIPPTSGRVILQHQPVTGPRRDIGMMFQQATLFPWKTAVENIVLPIEIRDGKAAATRHLSRHPSCREHCRLTAPTTSSIASPRCCAGGTESTSSRSQTQVQKDSMQIWTRSSEGSRTTNLLYFAIDFRGHAILHR